MLNDAPTAINSCGVSNREFSRFLHHIQVNPDTNLQTIMSWCFASEMRARLVKNRSIFRGFINVWSEHKGRAKKACLTEQGKAFLETYPYLPPKPKPSTNPCIAYKVDVAALKAGTPIELLEKHNVRVLEVMW